MRASDSSTKAMAAVLAGNLTPFFTGLIYCNVIGACLELADVGRAGEWSDAARMQCDSLPPDSPYPGLCRVNRAGVRGSVAPGPKLPRRRLVRPTS